MPCLLLELRPRPCTINILDYVEEQNQLGLFQAIKILERPQFGLVLSLRKYVNNLTQDPHNYLAMTVTRSLQMKKKYDLLTAQYLKGLYYFSDPP